MQYLIVKTSSIGDIIQTFPVLEYLKKKDPDCEIDWVVEKEYEGLVIAHPLIRNVIPLHSRVWRKFRNWEGIKTFLKKLKDHRYNFLFDLQGNTKSGLITAMARAEKKIGYDWNSLPEFPNYFATKIHIPLEKNLQIQKKYLRVVQRFFGDETVFIPSGVELNLSAEEESCLKSFLGRHPRVMVAFGSRWKNKMLSEKGLEDLIQKIAEEKGNPNFYFIWGTFEEKKRADRLQNLFGGQSVGGLSFPLWQALMRKMELVVAVDSAALALCGTTKTPSISFFGPSQSQIYKPLGDTHVAWQGSCPYGQRFETRCSKLRSCKTGACLKKLDVGSLSLFPQKSQHR